MKKLLAIALLLGTAHPVHANNPNETLAELADRGRNSPTMETVKQVNNWYLAVQTDQSQGPLVHAYWFLTMILPQFFEARDKQLLREQPDHDFIASISKSIDEHIESLTSISKWAVESGFGQMNDIATQQLQEFSAWLNQCITKQIAFRSTYRLFSAPCTSPEPQIIWDQPEPMQD